MKHKISDDELKKLGEALLFIEGCSMHSCALIVKEVLMRHPMLVWDSATEQLVGLRSVYENGMAILMDYEIQENNEDYKQILLDFSIPCLGKDGKVMAMIEFNPEL